MKNKEKYYDEIIDYFASDNFCGFAKLYGLCDYDCECCNTAIKEWLEQEHKEPIKLTDDEKVILRNIDKKYKWITRNCYGDLELHAEEPYKITFGWDNNDMNYELDIFSHLFQFIKWEDEVPYSIEELLHE